MNDRLKEWKLVQSALGLVAASAVGFYLLSGSFQAREWFTFLPPSPTPDTLIFHADAMRQALKVERFSEALGEAEWVLAHDKENPEAFRARAACLLRIGRFTEAEKVFRVLIGKDKKDIPARLALSTALRGQGDEDRARQVLLRILKDPHADTLQLEAARAALGAMDFKEPLFADQPTPHPLASPSPVPSASPEPLHITAVKRELAAGGELGADGKLSTLAILTGASITKSSVLGKGTPGAITGLRPAPVVPLRATPEPAVAPVVLPDRPGKPTPTAADPGETEPGEPEPSPTPNAARRAEVPLELLPPPGVTPPTPLPILPATLPTTGKKLSPARPKSSVGTAKKPNVIRKPAASKKPLAKKASVR